MWCDILTNLVSDLIYSFLAVGFLLFLYLISKRKKLLLFFGINKSRKLTIFTSNLIVEKYGASGENNEKYSFSGVAIPNEESRSASQLQSIFNYFLPSQNNTSGLFSKILISDIDIKVLPAPYNENLIEQNGSIISLGFPPYNSISRYIETTFTPTAMLVYVPQLVELGMGSSRNQLNETRVTPSNDAAGTAVPIGNSITSGSVHPSGIASNDMITASGALTSGSSVPLTKDDAKQIFDSAIKVNGIPPFTNTSIGFIQKIFDVQKKRYFFYVAGLSENSTAGSAYYLANNWEELNKIYGYESAFYVLLEVSNTNNRMSQIILKS